MAWSEILHSSARQDWQTPPALFAALSRRFGPFGLDAAAHRYNAQAPAWIGRPDAPDLAVVGEAGCVALDALATPWGPLAGPDGRVWLNPEYGRSVGCWVARAYEQAERGGLLVCVLIMARTDTGWWHDYALRADTIVYLRGRVTFGIPTPHGLEPRRDKQGRPQAATAPSAALIFDGRTAHPAPRIVSMRTPREAWPKKQR